MNFNSLEFILFLPCVVFAHWLLPHKYRWMILLAASLYFYMSWNVALGGLLAAITLTSFICGRLLEICKKQWQRKSVLLLNLIICLGILIFFKYADYITQSVISVLSLFGTEVPFSTWNLLLPVGISFYTFQTLTYVIDVYRGATESECHLGYYALFVCFFPQLVAGPIERSCDLLPQLRCEKKFVKENFYDGIRWLLSGFIRKCVVADTVGMYVNTVYADFSNCNGVAVFLASGLFMIQIYNDFAGYSEIAMGSARLLGITLTKNFDTPLVSVTVTEFFRRWHITLNRWFTDYVYIPLGGNRNGMARKLFNTMVVFSLCGLWHGANHTYLLWGMVAGAFVCMESLLKRPCRILCERFQWLKSPSVLTIRRGVLLGLFTLSCVLFRSSDIQQVAAGFRKIVFEFDVSYEGFLAAFSAMGIAGTDLLLILSVAGIMAALPGLQKREERYIDTNETVLFVVGILAILLCLLNQLSTTGTSAFSYFQF